MDIFSQNKLLKWCVGVLVILNVLSLGIFFCKEYTPDSRRPVIPDDFRDVSGILQKELDLTPGQTEQIKKNTGQLLRKGKSAELHHKK